MKRWQNQQKNAEESKKQRICCEKTKCSNCSKKHSITAVAKIYCISRTALTTWIKHLKFGRSSVGLHDVISQKGAFLTFSRYSNGLRAGRQGFDSRQGQDFFLLHSVQTGPGATQLPVQWIHGVIYRGVKRLGCEADHLPPSSAKVKNGGAIPPLPHMSYHLF
jgi:hypothetical protein